MFRIALLVVLLGVVCVNCHPTMYKIKDNKLEPDLVPVSSTVIPLPVYKVSYGLNTAPSNKGEKLVRPDGPITLITVHSKKKAAPSPKPKFDQTSSIKEISKEEFSE